MSETKKGGDPRTNGCDCVYCRMVRVIRPDDQVDDIAVALGRQVGSVIASMTTDDGRASVVQLVSAVARREADEIMSRPEYAAIVRSGASHAKH